LKQKELSYNDFLILLSGVTAEQAYEILKNEPNHEYRNGYEHIIKNDPYYAYCYANFLKDQEIEDQEYNLFKIKAEA